MIVIGGKRSATAKPDLYLRATNWHSVFIIIDFYILLSSSSYPLVVVISKRYYTVSFALICLIGFFTPLEYYAVHGTKSRIGKHSFLIKDILPSWLHFCNATQLSQGQYPLQPLPSVKESTTLRWHTYGQTVPNAAKYTPPTLQLEVDTKIEFVTVRSDS